VKLVVAATPKAGNTWLKYLLAEIYHLRVVHPDALAESGEDVVAQEHWWPDEARLAWLAEHAVTPVTIVRHPADVVVSLYHFVWMQEEPLESQRSIVADRDGIGAGTLDWAERELYRYLLCSDLWREAGAPCVRYEDLLADPLPTLRALTARLRPVEDEALERAIVVCRFASLRATVHPSALPVHPSSFFRRGGTAYRDELPPELLELLGSEPFLELMRRYGYELEMEPVTPFDVSRLDPFRGRDRFSNGARLSPALHRLLLTAVPDLVTWPRPWRVTDGECLFNWLNAPERPGSGVTNLMRLIYAQRPDLQRAFPDVDAAPRGFQLWFLGCAGSEYGVGAEFLAPVRRLLAAGAGADGPSLAAASAAE